MSEWAFIETTPAEGLCRLEYFEIHKVQDGRKIPFRITVREHIHPPDLTMKFYAEADQQTNQRTAPYTPSGWGSTLSQALWECISALRRFPYEGQL
jgi:hypothetical protein